MGLLHRIVFYCVSGVLISLVALPAARAQEYLYLEEKTVGEVQALADAFGLPPIFTPISAVKAYRMVYQMPYLGDTITVSGALFEPTDMMEGCETPVSIYMHGTTFIRENTPSFLTFEGQTGYLMAAMGFTVLMPDYVGLGLDDQHLHPYMHAQSESDAGSYMIQALAETESENPVGNLHDMEQLFVSGYSQGGHAAMALHRDLQANWPQYTVAASAPQSGPYDISGSQFPLSFANPAYSNPAYLIYVALAWQHIYGNLYENLDDLIQEPYASQVPALFDGNTSANDINDLLPVLSEDLLQPGILEALFAEGSNFIIAAEDNDVYQWIPEAPLQMAYCTEDEQVFFENALAAESYMNENGAENVWASNLGAYNHTNCAGLAIFGSALWMSSLATICPLSSVDEQATSGEGIAFPNPVDAALQIEGWADGTKWTAYDLAGREVARGVLDGSGVGTAHWAEGWVLLRNEKGETLSVSVVH